MWLVATQHCGLEAAGVWDAVTGSEHAACCAADGCGHDGCDLVERESIPTTNFSLKVPAPQLFDCVHFLCMQAIQPVIVTEPSAEFAEGVERPLGWVPAWHFTRRAAQPPRAPSLIRA
jgi:hypothetical protein